MKIQHLSTRGYEAYVVDTVLRSLKATKGSEITITHEVCKKDEISSKLDEECSVLVLTGFALDKVLDTLLFQQLNTEYNVPFVEVFIIGSMSDIPIMPSFEEFKGSETVSAVKEFYNYIVDNDKTFLEVDPDHSVEAIVELYNRYNTYQFSESDHDVLLQKVVADAYKFGYGTMVHNLGATLYMNNPLIQPLAIAGLLDVHEYVARHARWTQWKVVQVSDGSYMTVGVVSAELHKNEVAHRLINMSNTDKVAIVVLEDKGYTQMTIRTRQVDAVWFGQLADKDASGKEHACTVFLNLPRTATTVIEAFTAQIT